LAEDEKSERTRGEARSRGKLGPREMALKGARQALILKRASASPSSGQWNDDDFDVVANGIVVGRIFKSNSSPVGRRGCGR
jgi:hypothetical protein